MSDLPSSSPNDYVGGRHATEWAPSPRCRVCKFFFSVEINNGEQNGGMCRRMPIPVPVPRGYWCGEFKAGPEGVR